MSKKPICVAFLWHMHQPDYRDTLTGEIFLPWTRFHAVKDYYDMGALIERARGVHVTLNVVPSLMEQLTAYGAGTARESYAGLTLRDASALNEYEKSFLLRKFFQLSPTHMMLPYPRYKDLLDRRGIPDPQGNYPTGLSLYTTRDYRDLQMWYNLTWCGRELRRNPEIAAFLERGRDFIEPDKKRLLEIQYSFMGRILPLYRKLSESKKVELSVSPYYHPILPLLCDLRSAREALPSLALPAEPFAFPEDARQHIARALRAASEFFGGPVRGMWPSEGAVSDAALRLAMEEGLRWLASDEIVLWNSLQKEGQANRTLSPERKFCAYRWGQDEAGPCLFFRDHALSDLFGFSYYQWDAGVAVADFLRRLRAIHQSLPDDGRHYIVPVILDGENAWEHYPDNAADFLGLLYSRLEESQDIRTVTFSEFLDLETHREPLKSVVAGSWIYGNLATWVGHPEKNRAWQELSTARSFLRSVGLGGGPQKLDSAFQEIMIAEGSDWFWWYGDDHQTENAAEFDALFRGHLKNVYKSLDETPPLKLEEPIKKATAGVRYRNPVHTITPHLDGKSTDYFEWLSAGWAAPGGGDSMHRTDRIPDQVFFGFDLRHFYLRIDLKPAKWRISCRAAPFTAVHLSGVPGTGTRRDGRLALQADPMALPDHLPG
jgi:alpha-amylase/alpha-mannosidase (GH57 family)